LIFIIAGLASLADNWPYLIIGLIPLALTAFVIYNWRKTASEGFVIYQIEGVPVREMIGSSSAASQNTYFYKFEDGDMIKVPKAAYEVLIEGQPHRVYHTKGGHRLLSIEVLPYSWGRAQSTCLRPTPVLKSKRE
jgi:hypothetical protein